MRNKPGMTPKPALDFGMFVPAVIVHDQMQLELPGKLLVELFEKFQKLLMPMPRVTLTDHFALGHFQCGKQRGRPVAFVVVSHRPTSAFLQRQTRLSAIQGLYLALFINTQHQGFARRVEIESNDIGELFQKMHIPGEFEVLGPMRLDLMALPDPIHRRLAHARPLGHRPATPMRGTLWTTLQTRLDDGSDFVRRVLRLSSTALGYLPQAIGPVLTETSAPERDAFEIHLQLLGDFLVLATVRGGQNDSTSLAHLLRSGVSIDPLCEFLAVLRLEDHGLCDAWHVERIHAQINNSSYL